MAAPLRTSRDDWTDAGLRSLAECGSAAVRVETLAAQLGVTKGGFYFHFADRQALLDAMLERWEEQSVDQGIEQVRDAGGDARDRLQSLFRLAGSSKPLLEVEIAVRDWARRDPAVAERVVRVDQRRLDFLRHHFRELCASAANPEVEADARCLLVMTLFVGRPLLDPRDAAFSRDDVLARALRLILNAP